MNSSNIKKLLVFTLLTAWLVSAGAQTCPSVSSDTTITSSCSTGIVWTGGSLTIGNNNTSISITNTIDIAAIEANSSTLGSISNKANNSIGDVATGNAIQNNSGSTINGIYNYGSLIAENAVWNDGTITSLYNYGAISSTNGGIWNNAGSINNIYNTGSITVGGGANGTYNNGFISSFNNLGSITVGNIGTGVANGGDGVITTLNNSGAITVGSAHGGGSWGISNGGVITTLNNSGSISLLDDGYGISNSNVITTLNNSGSINVVNGKGIWNISGTGTITTLNNSGTINAGGGDILNDGTIVTLNNYSSLAGSNVGVNNTGTLITLNNINSINITSTDSGVGVANSGTLTALNNIGSITVEGTNANAVSNSGILSTLNNYGAMTVSDGGSYTIYNSGAIASLTNTGSINSGVGGSGIYIDGSGTISTLTNTGSISVGAGGVGINNMGTITTLNNSQGGNQSSPSTTALSFSGNMPTNYNIAFVNPTHYGQLATDPGVTIANVGIYGTPFLTSRIYASILSNDVTVTNLQSVYDNMTVTLVNNISTGYWDIAFTGISLMGTQQSLVNTANSLAPIFTLQNSVLANSFSYDCNTFGVNNVCISAGGRNTAVSAANGLNNSSALLIAAYRPHPNYRIGAYADQNLSVNNAGSTMNLGNNTPLIGVFGAWNERLDGTGTEFKISAAYGQKNATINRQAVGLGESGTGSSQLNSQGAQVVAKYGFSVAKDTIASPYIGMRYTQNNMNGYTEVATNTTTLPLTYSALNTNATTALIGLGASYKGISQTTLFASAGIESDTNTSNGSYYGSNPGIPGITPVNFNPNPVKTRPTATLGAYYDVEKNQRMGITGIYRQEPYQAVQTTTVMATYTVGL